MAERPIDELKIKISVDESGNVDKSLDSIIAKLEKINEAGKGANAFASLLTTLSNMDKSLSKISNSLTRVANGMKTISAHAEAFGGKFSGSLNNIDKGMQNISEAARESAKGLSAITNEAQAVERTFGNARLEKFLDDSSVTTVTERLIEVNGVALQTSETVSQLSSDFEEVTEVDLGKVFGEFDAASKAVDNLYNTMTKVVTEEERLNAIDMSKQFTQVDLLKEKYNELADKLALMLKEPNWGGSALANLIAQMQKIQAQIERLESTATRVETVNPFKKWANAASNAAKNLAKTHLNLKSLATALFRIQTFPIAGIVKQVGHLHTRVNGLVKSFLRVAKMRALRYTIRMIVAGIREGIDNAYQWARIMGNEFAASMDSIATTSLYLKNSLGALATPIINIVAPAFDKVIDKVVDLINLINQLIAKLSGATSWVRAVRYAKEYSDAIGTAAGNAGKLAEELITVLGIDELNRMDVDKSSGSGSGGGGGSDLDYSSMFETVEEFDALSGRLGELFEPFKKAWETKGQTVMASIENALANIRYLSTSVGDSFWSVWQNGTGQKTIEHILDIFTGIADTIGNISRQLSVAWNFDNIGTGIVQNLWDTLNGILDMWSKIGQKTAEWAGQLDLKGVLSGLRDITGAIKNFMEPLERFAVNVWEKAILPFSKWVIESVAPVALTAIADAIESIRLVWELLEPAMNWLWDNILSPTLGAVGGWVLDALEGLADFLESIKDFLQDISDLIHGDKTLMDFLNSRAYKPGNSIIDTRQGWQGDTTTTPETIVPDITGYLYDREYTVPVTLEATDLNDKVPTSKKTIADILAEANALDTVGIPARKRKVSGLTGAVDTLDNQLPSDKSYLLGLIGGVSRLENRLDTRHNVIDNITAAASKLTKGLGFTNTVSSFVTYATGLTRGAGFTNNIQTFPTYASRLDKATGFSSAIQNFFAHATSLLAGSGYSNKIQSFIAYALSLSQGSGYKNNISTFAAYGSSLGAASGYVNKLSTFAAYGSSLGAASGYKNNIQTFPTYATSLNKASGFRGFTVTGYASTGGGGKVSVTLNKNGGIFSNGMWKSIPQYAGGTLNAGSMFIAGEAGPEIVGNVRGRTEVLNQSQIAQAMAQSMQVANSSQNGLLQEQNALLRELINKQGNARAYVTSGDIIDGLTQRNRRDGRTVVAIGV